jgi:hypothetical protein
METLLPALFALAGSLIGGVATGFGGWLTERSRLQAEQHAHEVARREELYRDFIIIASKVHGEALLSNDPAVPDLVNLHAAVSRMRVVSPPKLVASAEAVTRSAMIAFSLPPKSVAEVKDLIKRGMLVDPLRAFSELAREDLQSGRL